jgi:hypothetical protein
VPSFSDDIAMFHKDVSPDDKDDIKAELAALEAEAKADARIKQAHNVQHHILQLTQEDVFLYRPNPSLASLLSKPFNPMRSADIFLITRPFDAARCYSGWQCVCLCARYLFVTQRRLRNDSNSRYLPLSPYPFNAAQPLLTLFIPIHRYFIAPNPSTLLSLFQRCSTPCADQVALCSPIVARRCLSLTPILNFFQPLSTSPRRRIIQLLMSKAYFTPRHSRAFPYPPSWFTLFPSLVVVVPACRAMRA